MNILVSATRQPFALDEIRKLGRAGHRITALDSFPSAPGSHSRYVHRRVVAGAPRLYPQRFINGIRRAIRENDIDLVLPTFEEVFYLARHLESLCSACEVFTSPFETLARLHHKGTFSELARSLGLRVPPTTVVTDRRALREALEHHRRYLVRPAYSRGGTKVLTNAGPQAGLLRPEDCRPTRRDPWLVQDWIEGEDVCTFSIVRHGSIRAHVCYVLPIDLEHGSGIVIESIDAPESLEIAARVVKSVGYHGQVSFDFRRAPDGELVLVECNPRASCGVTLMPDEMFSEALWGDPREPPRVVGAGRASILSLAVIRDMLIHPGRIPQALKYLVWPRVRDVFFDPRDPLPALYQVFTYGQLRRYRRWAGPVRDRRTDIIEAFSYDFAWQGERIP